MRITAERVWKHEPCYTWRMIKELFDGRAYLSLNQIMRLSISLSDKLWCLAQFKPELLIALVDAVLEYKLKDNIPTELKQLMEDKDTMGAHFRTLSAQRYAAILDGRSCGVSLLNSLLRSDKDRKWVQSKLEELTKCL